MHYYTQSVTIELYLRCTTLLYYIVLHFTKVQGFPPLF